jgi:alpha-beta hydrolase superfamily lysophospholipase
VTYMTWIHMADTTQCEPIYSACDKFRTIKSWKRQVFTHCWFPSDKPPVAFMLMCHGLHEHGGRYDDYMRGIVARTGVAVVGIDWAGHGRSCDEHKEGPDGKMPSFHLVINDALSLIQRVVTGDFPAASQIGAAGEKDWYLFGHSMGGCIAINLVLERPGFFKAVCLSAPLTDATYGQAGKCVLVPLLSCLSSCLPNMILTFSPLITPNQLTHDLAKQDENMHDKLNIQNQVRTRLSCELVKATKVSVSRGVHLLVSIYLFIYSFD